jgi:hypothetical protein
MKTKFNIETRKKTLEEKERKKNLETPFDLKIYKYNLQNLSYEA